MPGEKFFGLNRTTVLLCSVLLDVSTGLRDAGFRATFVAFGSTPSFSEVVFLPFPPSVWSVLQTHAQSVHTLALTNNTKNSNIVTHVPSVSHVEQHLGAHKHNFFPPQQGRSQFPCCFSWEELLLRCRERERTLSVSITSKAVWLRKLLAFWNSNGDILHLYKLARHSEIVPLINNLKL